MPVMEISLLNCKGNRDYGADIFVDGGGAVCATVADFGGISGGNLEDIGFGFADCAEATT